jgi:hypothetical protein
MTDQMGFFCAQMIHERNHILSHNGDGVMSVGNLRRRLIPAQAGRNDTVAGGGQRGHLMAKRMKTIRKPMQADYQGAFSHFYGAELQFFIRET